MKKKSFEDCIAKPEHTFIVATGNESIIRDAKNYRFLTKENLILEHLPGCTIIKAGHDYDGEFKSVDESCINTSKLLQVLMEDPNSNFLIDLRAVFDRHSKEAFFYEFARLEESLYGHKIILLCSEEDGELILKLSSLAELFAFTAPAYTETFSYLSHLRLRDPSKHHRKQLAAALEGMSWAKIRAWEPSFIRSTDLSEIVTYIRGLGYSARSNLFFEDVAGRVDLKQWFLTDISPEGYHSIMLVGEPGTGKTMFLSALANELGRNLLILSSSNLLSMYYGESEKQIDRFMNQVVEKAPCLVFMDEIDGMIHNRDTTQNETTSRILGHFYQAISSLQSGEHDVFLVSATNRPWAIDEAATRRFARDGIVYLGIPDKRERKVHIEFHTKDYPNANINLTEIVAKTDGFSCADLHALCRFAIKCAQAQNGILDDACFATAFKNISTTVSSDCVRQMRTWCANHPNVRIG